MSTERSDLLAKSPVRMTDKKILVIFWDAGNAYRCRLQILGNLSGKHFGWNGMVGICPITQAFLVLLTGLA